MCSRSLWRLVGLGSSLFALFIAQTSAADLQLLTHKLVPFTASESGASSGFAVDLVDEILSGAGDVASVTVVPFARLLAEVQQGRNTAGFIIARTPERENTMQWVGPLIRTGVYVYSKAEANLRLETFEDLRTLDRIGVQNQNADDLFLTKQGFTNLERRSSQANALLGVEAGRLAAAPMSELVFEGLVRELGLSPADFRRAPVKLYEVSLYLGVSKDVAVDRVARWSASLEALRGTGRYQALLEKYGLAQEKIAFGP